MARDWKTPHSDAGDMPLKPFRDPISGKKLNSVGDTRSESEVRPRPAGSDYLRSKPGQSDK